jgi:type IV pilus assembly protein PilW
MTRQFDSQGFSLIELMVGVLIAIISTIVMYQLFSVSERQKRTTTGAADAQSNGAIGFYMIDRDVKMAGWGLEHSAFNGCDTLFTFLDDGASAGPINDLFASVLITDGGGNPDTITIQYYDNPSNPDFKMAVTGLRSTMPSSSAELNVNSTYGCEIGDLAIVAQGGNCTLMEITQVQESALKLQHNPGGTPSYNPPNNYQNANGWPAYSTGANMQCISKIFRRIYSIQNQGLALSQPDAAWVMQTFQVVPEIIALEAQYGIADAGGQQVTQWVNATGAWASPLTVANARRIKALRVSLVARSGEFEKPDETGVCNTTTPAMVANWSTWAAFSTAGFPADWQCYRYKAFETVMPLRNIIWANL